MALPPASLIEEAVALASSSLISAATTLAPSGANASAMA
jgi:hypothetical protein